MGIDENIAKHFSFLVNDPGTAVIKKVRGVIILRHQEILVRLIQDRADFFTDIASINDPDQWTDLHHFLEFLYRKSEIKKKVKPVNKPRAQATTLKQYLPIIYEHFNVLHYQKTKTALAVYDRSAGVMPLRFYSKTIMPLQKVFVLINNLDFEDKFRKFAPKWSTVAVNRDGQVVSVIRYSEQPNLALNDKHIKLYPDTAQFTASPGMYPTLEELEKKVKWAKKVLIDY